MSDIFLSIKEPAVIDRYIEKISIIKNIDPYTLLPDCSYVIDLKNFPNIGILDINSYFVDGRSAYTTNQLKNYKSLEAFNYSEAGFVSNILCLKITPDHFTITAKVSCCIKF